MDVQVWTYIIVGLTFALYIAIAIRSRAGSTKEFYVAGGGVSPLANGLATAADWMSAASFLGMAGIISFSGRDGSVYLMGWTGGYVLLALLLAPYLRKFGKFTVPDFVGDRYYSQTARIIAVVCALFISFTYVAGQMRGVGIVFSRFLQVDITLGVIIGMAIVFLYAVLGGMKGITYTQVAQYCVLIFAFSVPAIYISIMLTGNAVPQLGFGSDLINEPGVSLLDKLDGLSTELGFDKYTTGKKDTMDTFFITMALMVGTAGLPHVIVRFFTVPKVSDARKSGLYALFFIAILYTVAPAVSAFARTNLLDTIPNTSYKEAPDWFRKWEKSGLIAWKDKNQDGIIQYTKGKPFEGKPNFVKLDNGDFKRGFNGEIVVSNKIIKGENELYIDKDIMVLANPEIAGLPDWVIALVAAGGLAAALSTAAGLLLVISTSVAHDLIKKSINPNISEKGELYAARLAAIGAVLIAGYFGINPPDYVAAVVALAFGLAAASFFPILILGIFSKKVNKQGAICGMLIGLASTLAYIIYFKFVNVNLNTPENWLFGISPEGFGTVGMVLNFIITLIVSKFTPEPPTEVQNMVENIRYPGDAKG
ncbi:MAG: cation acetate symporter [Flavobacteriales bacterium]|nr:cation acetate symporter [Flavobacteriales bacterium]